MQARRLLTPLFAVAMLSASCALPSGESSALPPPPPVDDTINVGASFPNDGLTRLIVQPVPGAPLPAVNGAEELPANGSTEPVDPSRLLTPEMVAAIPPGAALEARDGQVGYVDGDGNWFALERPAAPEPETAPEPVEADDEPEDERVVMPLYGNPFIDELATDPAVERVVVIGDGTYGIETTDPSVVDPEQFVVTEDVAFGVAQDPYEIYQWYLENDGSGLRRLASVTQTEDADLDIFPTVEQFDGSGVVIAVIDSGVDFSHPDLANSAWSNLDEVCDNDVDDDANGFVDDCVGWDFVGNDAQPYQRGSHAHGTHVAGIIAANRDGRGVAGVAPNARIMDLNVAYPNGSMSGASITAAIRYAVDNGADIINMSLGTNPGASAAGMGGMRDALEYAGANGVLVVVAAGNSNVDLGSLAVYPASFDLPNMIVVGASAPDDTKAKFSNFNASIVDLYAPGVLMLSTMPNGGYRFMSGTSQASPAAAGVAALLMEANPGVTFGEVAEQLSATVDQVDSLATSMTSGRLNAASALGLGDAPPLATEPSVAVSGLVDATNAVNAKVSFVVPPDYFDEEFRWELTLIQSTEAGAYAIVEHPFVVGGTSTATGLTGAFILGPSVTERVEVSTDLPAGQYSFLIEAVPTASGNQRLGDAFVTTFVVDGSESEIGSTTTTTAPDPSDGGDAGTPAVGDGTSGDVGGGDSGSGGGATTTTVAGSDPVQDDEPGEGDTTTTLVEPGAPVTTVPILTPTTAPANPTDTNEPAQGGTADGGGEVGTGGGSEGDAQPTTTVPSFEAGQPTGGGGGSATTTPSDDQTFVTSPTTAPTPIPTGPAPVPPDVGDDAATEGEWVIESISPQAGYVDSANRVSLRGNFPSQTYVWFGDQPGQVVSQTADFISVRTPLRSEPGIVDLTLRTAVEGLVLTVEDGFAFVDASGSTEPGDAATDTGGSGGGEGTGSGGGTDGGATGGGSGDAPSGDAPSGGGDSSGDNPSGGDQAGDAPGSTEPGDTDPGQDNDDNDDDGETGGDGSDGDEPASQRSDRTVIGAAVPLANGLRGAAITPNPAEGTPVCTTDPCAAVRR